MKNDLGFDNVQTNRPEYLNHIVFASLTENIDFYRTLSDTVMTFPTMGTRAIINIDTYVYSSIAGTLESINIILKNGRIGDAFALLRKYHDSTILNVYTNLYLEDNRDASRFIVEEINDWIKGTKKLPDDQFRTMSKYIENSDKLKPLTDIIFNVKSYRETRKRCNDHTHYNYLSNLLINDNEIRLDYRMELLNTFEQDLKNLFIHHLSYIFFLNDHYMGSSDYIDALEMGNEPEEGSQYWVAPFIQKVFSDVIESNRPDLGKLIINNSNAHISSRGIPIVLSKETRHAFRNRRKRDRKKALHFHESTAVTYLDR